MFLCSHGVWRRRTCVNSVRPKPIQNRRPHVIRFRNELPARAHFESFCEAVGRAQMQPTGKRLLAFVHVLILFANANRHAIRASQVLLLEIDLAARSVVAAFGNRLGLASINQ